MSNLDFSHLIAPHAVADFLAQHWERSPLLIKRDEPDRYRTLIEADEVRDVLTLAEGLPAAAVEIIGRPGSDGSASQSSIVDLFRGGATIRIRGIQQYRAPLGELCQSLEKQFGCPVRANLYCTPENSRGFDLHFDTHEVLVVQLLGKKTWEVFTPTSPLPLEHLPPLPFETDRSALKRARGGREAGQDNFNERELGAPAVEASLEAGDSLYLPRGFVHRAAAQDEASVHLTIGIHALTWLDLLSVALGQSANRHEVLREALPLGMFNDQEHQAEFASKFVERLQRFTADADFEGAVAEIAESFGRRSKIRPADSSSIRHDTVLKPNGQLRFYLSADGKLAGLSCDQNQFWMPVSFTAAMRFVAEQYAFRPCDLPGQINESGKITLTRRLVDEGLLRLG